MFKKIFLSLAGVCTLLLFPLTTRAYDEFSSGFDTTKWSVTYTGHSGHRSMSVSDGVLHLIADGRNAPDDNSTVSVTSLSSVQDGVQFDASGNFGVHYNLAVVDIDNGNGNLIRLHLNRYTSNGDNVVAIGSTGYTELQNDAPHDTTTITYAENTFYTFAVKNMGDEIHVLRNGVVLARYAGSIAANSTVTFYVRAATASSVDRHAFLNIDNVEMIAASSGDDGSSSEPDPVIYDDFSSGFDTTKWSVQYAGVSSNRSMSVDGALHLIADGRHAPDDTTAVTVTALTSVQDGVQFDLSGDFGVHYNVGQVDIDDGNGKSIRLSLNRYIGNGDNVVSVGAAGYTELENVAPFDTTTLTYTENTFYTFAVKNVGDEIHVLRNGTVLARYAGNLAPNSAVSFYVHAATASSVDRHAFMHVDNVGVWEPEVPPTQVVVVPTTILSDMYDTLSQNSGTFPVVETADFTVAKYSLVPGPIPENMGSIQRTSLNERLARGISPSNTILRTGATYYDEERGVDVYAASDEFFIEYDNGAVELMYLPEGMPAGQAHPTADEVPHGARAVPDLGEVPKQVQRTGLTFYDVARGIDVYANEGHYLIEYADGTIEQRKLPEGGFVPRPEDFTSGGLDNSQPRSAFGPTPQELGIVDDSNNPKPSSELVLIGDRYVSTSGKVRVAKEGSVFMQDPVTKTILLRPAEDAAVAIPNTNVVTKDLASHDVAYVTDLFAQAYSRAPTAKELDYWKHRTDKSGAALLGAMEYAYQQEQVTQNDPSDVRNKMVAGLSVEGGEGAITPNDVQVVTPNADGTDVESSTLSSYAPASDGTRHQNFQVYLIKDFETWDGYISWLENAADDNCNNEAIYEFAASAANPVAGAVVGTWNTSFCTSYDIFQALSQEDFGEELTAVGIVLLGKEVGERVVTAGVRRVSKKFVFVQGSLTVSKTLYNYYASENINTITQSMLNGLENAAQSVINGQ